jgi:hypothetical protein
MTTLHPDLAAVMALGWLVAEEQDARGRTYYRAYWMSYTRGGSTPAALRDCVESTLAAVHQREAEAGRVQLRFEVEV